MSLRRFRYSLLKKRKPVFYRYWFSSGKFFFEVKGPLGVIVDSISDVGIVFDKIKGSFFFLNFSVYLLFLSKIRANSAGVCFGYYVDMFYKGLGYRAWVYNSSLYSSLGYSNILKYDLPASIIVKARKNQLLFFSVDLNLLNSVASSLRRLKLPDPYRGKGVRFVDVDFIIKPGKQR